MFALVEAIRAVLGSNRRILSVFPTSNDPHQMVFAVDIDDDSAFTARIGCNLNNDASSLPISQRRYAGEAAALSFLSTVLPQSMLVPTVTHLDLTTNNPLGLPFILLENPFGDELTSILSELTFEEKERIVRQVAELAAQIYRITLSTVCGTISGVDARGNLMASPSPSRSESPDGGRSDRPFDSLKQYLTHELKAFIHRLSQDEGPEAAHEASLLAGRLLELFPHILPSNDPSMMRVTLAYSDLREGCIIVNEDNCLAGVIGKKATALPACLSASIPAFLRTDGNYGQDEMDLDDDESQLVSEEIAHLQNVYIEAARRIDPTFPIALAKGERIRQMFEYISDGDINNLLEWEDDLRNDLKNGSIS
ncbi:Phosphotransferase enzyme [Tulasnella sp. 418]|nr:Phosphotransferase enzyme [Tulasnella sp. 418]